MDIKAGMKFLCTKSVHISYSGKEEYSVGKIYMSIRRGYITNNSGNDFHSWNEGGEKYFIPLSKVNYIYTEATPKLREVFRNYRGAREGERRNLASVLHFSTGSINPQDSAFTAHTADSNLPDGAYYTTEETFLYLTEFENNRYKSYIGRSILGFKFNQSDYPDVGWNDHMESNLYRAGVIEGYNEYNNSFSVRFEDLKAWDYPAYMVVDQIEGKDALVELSNSESYDSEQEVFNPKSYYDNSKGSLYKVATERGWNAYLFDLVKRLERGGKKDPLRQEIEKSIDVLKIWLNELPEQSN